MQERKTEGPGENLQKQVCTGNQMYSAKNCELNPSPLVH